MHDPELIPIGIKLKKLNKKVIYDSHEDLPKQIYSKTYLNLFSKIILSKFFKLYQHFTLPKFDAVISATPSINESLSGRNLKLFNINKFNLLNELNNNFNISKKKNEIAYIGVISKIRGIEQLVLALEYTKGIKLNLAGLFSEKKLEKKIKKQKGWSKVNELGFLNRSDVKNILRSSILGIITFLPEQNHIKSQPNKIFEYMSASLPVIASNFFNWQKIIEENKCGICVNPLNPKEIANAIKYIVDNPLEAEMMGKNGRDAVVKKFNWSIEEQKLFNLYRDLLK